MAPTLRPVTNSLLLSGNNFVYRPYDTATSKNHWRRHKMDSAERDAHRRAFLQKKVAEGLLPQSEADDLFSAPPLIPTYYLGDDKIKALRDKLHSGRVYSYSDPNFVSEETYG